MTELRRRPLVAYLVLVLGPVLDVVLSATGHRSQPLIIIVFALAEATGLLFCGLAATHPRLSAAERRPWRYLLAWFAIEIVYGGAIGNSALASSGPPERLEGALLVALVARVAEVPVLMLGLLAFATQPLTTWARRKLTMDVATVVGVAAMVLWYWVVGPGLFGPHARQGSVRLGVMVFPICDLVLAVGLMTVLMRGEVAGARRSVQLLLAGLTSQLGIDVLLTYQAVIAPAAGTTVWSDLLAYVPQALIVAAAIERCRVAGERRGTESPVLPLPAYTVLPYVALAGGYALLVTVAIRAGAFPWPGLVGGAVIMTGAVAARQIVSLRENHQLAITDSLTGLANRLLLRERMAKALDRARRTGAPMALLLIDLDGFKLVNDTFGHEAGDAVLVEFARILKRYVRSTDTPARLGGDEFAVLLDGITDAQDAVEVARRLLDETRNAPGVDGNPALKVGGSIGIAVGDPLGRAGLADPHKMLRQADQAMYVAKKAGASGWCMYTPELDQAVEQAAQEISA